eukprot:3434680-Rhodomonas_salina.2
MDSTRMGVKRMRTELVSSESEDHAGEDGEASHDHADEIVCAGGFCVSRSVRRARRVRERLHNLEVQQSHTPSLADSDRNDRAAIAQHGEVIGRGHGLVSLPPDARWGKYNADGTHVAMVDNCAPAKNKRPNRAERERRRKQSGMEEGLGAAKKRRDALMAAEKAQQRQHLVGVYDCFPTWSSDDCRETYTVATIYGSMLGALWDQRAVALEIVEKSKKAERLACSGTARAVLCTWLAQCPTGQQRNLHHIAFVCRAKAMGDVHAMVGVAARQVINYREVQSLLLQKLPGLGIAAAAVPCATEFRKTVEIGLLPPTFERTHRGQEPDMVPVLDRTTVKLNLLERSELVRVYGTHMEDQVWAMGRPTIYEGWRGILRLLLHAGGLSRIISLDYVRHAAASKRTITSLDSSGSKVQVSKFSIWGVLASFFKRDDVREDMLARSDSNKARSGVPTCQDECANWGFSATPVNAVLYPWPATSDGVVNFIAFGKANFMFRNGQ